MEDYENIDDEMPISNRPEVVAEKSNGKPKTSNPGNIDLLMDVSLRVTVELGRTHMQLAQILELQHGSVVELDRLAGDPEGAARTAARRPARMRAFETACVENPPRVDASSVGAACKFASLTLRSP